MIANTNLLVTNKTLNMSGALKSNFNSAYKEPILPLIWESFSFLKHPKRRPITKKGIKEAMVSMSMARMEEKISLPPLKDNYKSE